MIDFIKELQDSVIKKDQLERKRKGDEKFGITRKYIGPAPMKMD